LSDAIANNIRALLHAHPKIEQRRILGALRDAMFFSLADFIQSESIDRANQSFDNRPRWAKIKRWRCTKTNDP
jgi:hypothetical protein